MATERVHFRITQMPCCGQLVCWVNPRLPNYCPECGQHVFTEIKSKIMLSDNNAILKYNESKLL